MATEIKQTDTFQKATTTSFWGDADAIIIEGADEIEFWFFDGTDFQDGDWELTCLSGGEKDTLQDFLDDGVHMVLKLGRGATYRFDAKSDASCTLNLIIREV